MERNSPQLYLNTEMYQHLKSRIKQAQDIQELIPFIKYLTNIDELKLQLVSSLDTHYKIIDNNKNESPDKRDISQCNIRPLFISLFKFNGIPSDIMHANIISYLPSKDYIQLPLVCKYFHNVMLNHPFIYNEKGYKVHISPSPYGAEPLSIGFDHIKTYKSDRR